MKLQLYHYTCESCGQKFKAPEVHENSYGEFLLRDQKGNVSYLNALTDDTFNEVHNVVKNNSRIKGMSDLDRSKLLHEIFGIACDVSQDNTHYSINTFPPCPNCSSNKMKSWLPTYPPEIVDIYIPSISHLSWKKLNVAEKLNLVDKAIELAIKYKENIGIIWKG